MAPDATRPPDSTPSVRGEWAWPACAALLVAAFGLAFLLQDRQFFYNDDVETYQMPGYREVARAWGRGELPLLSPCSWLGGALAGEYQVGVFSVVLTGLSLAVFAAGLPPALAAAVFALVHLAVLAAGTFRLARTRGLAPRPALLAALVASLNGWVFLWGGRQWFPALASFAWLPWFWWAIERALRPLTPPSPPGGEGGVRGGSWRSFLWAGLFLYLAITAGWPATVLMLLLLSAWLAARTLWQRRRLLAPWPVAAAWLIGLGLSAPAWLMLIEYYPATFRSQRPWNEINGMWAVPPDGWLGLLFPSYVTAWDVWGRWKPHACAEMTGGLVPLAVLGATLLRRGRAFLAERAWEIGLLGATVVLASLPGLGNFQNPFRWLPLFFLVLGLLAAHAWQGWETQKEAAPNPGVWAVALALAAWGAALLRWRDPTGVAVVHGAALLAVCLAWAAVGWRRLPAAPLRRWAPIAVLLLSCSFMYSVFPGFAEAPTWRVEDRLYDRPPLDPAVRYLSFYEHDDVFPAKREDALSPGPAPGAELFPGNTSMYSGVQIVNGYSPMRPRGLDRTCGVDGCGFFVGRSADRLLGQEAGPDGLLRLMGVDGLIAADRFLPYQARLEAEGWRPAAGVAGGRIFLRTGPPSPRVRSLDEALADGDPADAAAQLTAETGRPAPRVLTEPGRPDGMQHFAAAEVRLVEDGRNEAVADVANPSADRDALVVFSRPWYPGYRAECDGKPLPVALFDLTMPAVRLPPGTHGRLILRYRPRSLEIGAAAAAATAAACVLVLAAGWFARRRAAAREAAPQSLSPVPLGGAGG